MTDSRQSCKSFRIIDESECVSYGLILLFSVKSKLSSPYSSALMVKGDVPHRILKCDVRSIVQRTN